MAEFTPVTQLNEQAQAGWDAQQAEARKATAYNALRQQYGDQAGDPQAALEMQKKGFNDQNNPLLIQGNALSNQSAQQKIDFDTQDNPIRLTHDQDVNKNDALVQQENQQKIDAGALTARQNHATMLHGVFSGALDGLAKDGVGVTDPTQRGALFDASVARIAPLVGADDAESQKALAQERQRFVDGGIDAIPQMQSDLDAAVKGAMTPAERQQLQLGKTKLDIAQTNAGAAKSRADAAAAKAAGVTATGGALTGPALDKTVLNFTKVYGTPQKIQGSIGAAKTFDGKLGLLLGSGVQADDKDPDKVGAFGNDGLIQQSIDLTKKLQGQSKYQVQIQSHIKGTDAYNLQQNLDQIAHSAALTDLQNMRSNGLSLGRVTNAEFLAASQAIINADPTAKNGTLITQLNKLGDMYMATHNATQSELKAQQSHYDAYNHLVKGTIYGDPADLPGGANNPAAPAGGATTSAPVGATPPGAAATGQPGGAAPNPATMTPQQLQEQLGPQPISTQPGQQPQQQGQVGTAPDGTPVVQASAPAQAPPVNGPRIIPNFVASSNTQPLQQALSDPATARQLPAGMRNNNPGNIKYVGQRNTTPSQNTDEGDPQAVYTSPQAGMNAMASLATRKYNGGMRTPDQIIATSGTGWTPGNHQAAANVARTMGIGPNDDMNLNDPMQKAKFLRALMLQEHGPKSRLYPDSMVYAAVGANGSQPAGDGSPVVASNGPDNGPAPAVQGAGQPAPGAGVQSAQAAAAGGQQPATSGMQQMGDVTPSGAPAKGASNAGEQLAGMTPMQVATQPVQLPSALNLDIPGSHNNGFNNAGGTPNKHVAVLGNVDEILQHYGLRKKA